MKRKIYSLLIFVLPLFMAITNAHSQNTYEDLMGRFVIDLPQAWELEPQIDDKVFVFKGDGKNIIINCLPNVNDIRELFNKALGIIRVSGLTKPILEGELMDMTINEHPARWGIYKSVKNEGNLEITLFGLCGSIAFEENGLYFIAIIAKNDMAAWKEKVEKSFQSIRSVGQSLTGVKDLKAVSAPTTQGSPTVWKHELVTLAFPAGWKEKPKPRSFEKEIVGWFEYEPLASVHLIVACYKGFGMNIGKALEAGIRSVKITAPNAVPIKAEEIKVGKKKAYFVVHKGTIVDRGSEIDAVFVVSVVKADKSYVVLLGMAMSGGLSELEEQILEITRSVK